jgi:tRNA(adenine34) deaminase
MKKDTDKKFMIEAIKEAKKSYKKNEVPIGAVVVHDGKIVGRGHNEVECRHNATAHAEIIAISKAAQKLGDWRLNDCNLYVTVEPCLMCFGAITLSRISRLVYGTPEPSFGFINHIKKIPDKLEVKSGLLSSECKNLLSRFFRKLRRRCRR